MATRLLRLEDEVTRFRGRGLTQASDLERAAILLVAQSSQLKIGGGGGGGRDVGVEVSVPQVLEQMLEVVYAQIVDIPWAHVGSLIFLLNGVRSFEEVPHFFLPWWKRCKVLVDTTGVPTLLISSTRCAQCLPALCARRCACKSRASTCEWKGVTCLQDA